MKYIYQGTSFMRRGKRVQLESMQHIFDCAACEYVMTALTEEGAQALRDIHMIKCHPELLNDMRFEDRFGEIPEPRFVGPSR